MKLSLNWLNDFVDLSGIEAQEIMTRLSMVTAEVEGFEQKGTNIHNVIVGEIITCEPHPTSKKPLWKLTVNNGKETLPVVCGAPNCRPGLKVAYAQVGSKLGNINVGQATLASEISNGMCLSEYELGISTDHDGIVELSQNTINGTPIHNVLQDLNDTIFEIDNKSLTNRPDLWGHYGMARELSTIFNRKLKPLPTADLDKFKDLPPISTKIENKNDVLSLSTFKVQNITRKDTPIQIKARLFYCGMNSLGYIVDLSNYIMLELGQPNHAFDARVMKKVSAGNIKTDNEQIAATEMKSTFTTLHDQTLEVKPHHLFIKSDGKPVSLAGIIGGGNSLVKQDTTDVVFEIATFNASTIRKTSAELGIRTESSTRYEKSLDTNLNKLAAERILKLLYTHDKNAQVASSYNNQVSKQTTGKTITLTKEYLERYCGTKFNYAEVKRNLTGLGFSPVITDKDITVIVPTWRATKDVTMAVDIIEEIARTYGYDNIKPIAPLVFATLQPQLIHISRRNQIKDILSQKYALNEVHTYYWNDARALKDLKIETKSHIKIVNSAAAGCDNIRSELMPSLLHVVSKNKGQENIRIFEIGKVYKNYFDEPELKEHEHLCVAIASKTKSGEELYAEVANMYRNLFDTFGLKLEFKLGQSSRSYYHPKNNAVIYAANKVIGQIGIVHPTVCNAIDKNINIVVAPIRMDTLENILAEIKTTSSSTPISKFPKSTLDFTITTADIYGNLEHVVAKFTHELLQSYKLRDVYERENDDKSYTIQLVITSHDRTITTEEIQNVWQDFVNHIKANGYYVDNT